jgi:hypothetical protein
MSLALKFAPMLGKPWGTKSDKQWASQLVEMSGTLWALQLSWTWDTQWGTQWEHASTHLLQIKHYEAPQLRPSIELEFQEHTSSSCNEFVEHKLEAA